MRTASREPRCDEIVERIEALRVEKGITQRKMIEDLGLNSVNVLYLVIAIEEVFNIRFDDDTGVDTFKTVGDAADYIGGKLK